MGDQSGAHVSVHGDPPAVCGRRARSDVEIADDQLFCCCSHGSEDAVN
jgi:hypothetical protein